MKRAWAFPGIVVLSVILALGGCDKDQPGGRAPDAGASTNGAPTTEAASSGQAPEPKAAGRPERDGLDIVHIAQLPRQAVATLRLIEAGGPFPFEKDGVVFGNRERMLPRQPRGFYHEYTVPTPRARDRGARRIVCGGPRRQTDDCYYTDDHYSSFRRIAD